MSTAVITTGSTRLSYGPSSFWLHKEPRGERGGGGGRGGGRQQTRRYSIVACTTTNPGGSPRMSRQRGDRETRLAPAAGSRRWQRAAEGGSAQPAAGLSPPTHTSMSPRRLKLMAA
jgi:hypothetical protein